jgi:hypothetical protein
MPKKRVIKTKEFKLMQHVYKIHDYYFHLNSLLAVTEPDDSNGLRIVLNYNMNIYVTFDTYEEAYDAFVDLMDNKGWINRGVKLVDQDEH